MSFCIELKISYQWKEESWLQYNPFELDQIHIFFSAIVFDSWFYSKAGCFSIDLGYIRFEQEYFALISVNNETGYSTKKTR